MDSYRLSLYISLVLYSSGVICGQEHIPVTSGHSESDVFEFFGEQLPNAVNLNKLFRREVPQQGRTTLCTIFSSLALLEATCKSVTGEEMDLSESFITYRWLLGEMAFLGSGN